MPLGDLSIALRGDAGFRSEPAVKSGETLILLGRSGSGKTTTLKLINRLLEPTEGEIFVAGRSGTAWDPIELRRGIGYVIQDIGLFPHWSVERNVALVPHLKRWPEERIRARVTEIARLGRASSGPVRQAPPV